METIELYQKQLELILKPLNIVVNTDNINAKRYIDVEKNAFNEVKSFYTRIFNSYNDDELNQAIKNILPKLFIVD